MSEKRFNTGLLCIFSILAFVGVIHHELWSDEVHHFLIARDSGSISELATNLRYDGHPILWNSMLFVITRVTWNPVAMQILNACLAVGAIGIFLFFSPFTRIQKTLFISGYFILYEFTCFSRNYALVLLFLFTALAIFKNRNQNRIAYGLVLAFLANTHFLGTLLTISLITIDLWPWPFLTNTAKTVGGFSISLAGIALAFLQVIPPTDSVMVNNWMTAFSLANIYNSLFLFAKAFLPIPNFTQYHFWNHFLIMGLYQPLFILIGVLALIMPVYLFFRNKASLIFFYLAAGSIGGFLAISRLSGTRYFGIVFLALIAAQWMKMDIPENTGQKNNYRNTLITVLLVIQMTGGIMAWWLDLNRPFSESKNLANYITENRLTQYPLLTDNCIRASAIAYLQERAYFLSSQSYGSFCKWNEMGFPFRYLPDEVLVARSKAFAKQAHRPALLITNKPIQGDPMKEIKQLAAFDQAIIETENFYLYDISD